MSDLANYYDESYPPSLWAPPDPPPDVPATGAVAGSPGTFTPVGSTPPADFAGMAGLSAVPATAWTTGQYVVAGDASESFWNGTAWATGRATVVEEPPPEEPPA